VAAGTRSVDYRCSIPGLAEFINFPSPAAIAAAERPRDDPKTFCSLEIPDFYQLSQELRQGLR